MDAGSGCGAGGLDARRRSRLQSLRDRERQLSLTRVAYLVSQYPASSHTFIRREVEALRTLGVEVLTFSIRRPAPIEVGSVLDREAQAETEYVLPLSTGQLLAAHSVAAVRQPAAYLRTLALAIRHRAPGARALLWALFHFGEAVVLAAALRRRGVGRLHSHFANAGATVGLLAARLLGLPWSLTLHGISETDYPAGLLLPQKLHQARFVACASWFMRAQAMRAVGPEHWGKFIIARCGLPAELPRSAMPVDEFRTGRPRLICVGRLSPEKGQFGLLDCFARLIAEGLDAELRLVGDGPDRARLEARRDALGLGGRLSFVGRLDEAGTLAEIAAADVLVLPSFMEGLPVVLMEAMRLGVAVVASRVAGVPELVADEANGLLFTAGRWDELGDRLTRLLADGALRGRLAEAGKRTVADEFTLPGALGPLPALLGARASCATGAGLRPAVATSLVAP